MALVIDTGPLYASLDADDTDHRPCVQLIDTSSESLIVPAPVLTELEYMLARIGAGSAFGGFLDDIDRGNYRVQDLLPTDYRRVRELLDEYADLRVGFVDASVMAIVERLGEPKVATLDHRHFGVMRPRHVGALELLPA